MLRFGTLVEDMFKGIRNLKVKTPTGMRDVVVVKSKQWHKSVASVHWKTDDNSPFYLIAHPVNFRDWHKNKPNQAVFLHELGHMNIDIPIHWLDEVAATFVGWWKYRCLIPKENRLSLWEVFGLIWRIRHFIFARKGESKRQIERLHESHRKG